MALRNDWATGDWFGASDQNDVADAVNVKVDAGAAGSVVVGALPGSGVTGVLYVVP